MKPRRAFTLLELTLVLAVVVMVGAMVSPMASAMLGHQRLSSSADRVKTGLIQARLEAMRSGRPQVFQCSIGSGQITIQSWIDPADATNAADMAGTVTPGAMGVAATVNAGGGGRVIELEESVFCDSVQVASDGRSAPILTAVAATGTGGATSADGVTPVSAASPIVLYPDGTATDAMIVVKGPSGKVELTLRGLTGDIKRRDL